MSKKTKPSKHLFPKKTQKLKPDWIRAFNKTAASATNQQIPFIQKRKKTEVDCIFHFDSVLCRRKKENLSAAFKDTFCWGQYWHHKSSVLCWDHRVQWSYGNFCYIFELSLGSWSKGIQQKYLVLIAFSLGIIWILFNLGLLLFTEMEMVGSTFQSSLNLKYQQLKEWNQGTNSYIYKTTNYMQSIVIYQHSSCSYQLQAVALTSFLFCSKSSSLSLARFPIILFLSASYCRCVLSMLILRFNATFTKAVISFMATKNGKKIRIFSRLSDLRKTINRKS